MEESLRIELELGPAEWRVKDRIRELAEAYSFARDGSAAPSLTVLGPLPRAAGSGSLEAAVERAAEGFSHLPFLLDGWGRARENGSHVIGYAVRPSPALAEFRRRLARSVQGCGEPVSDGEGWLLPASPPLSRWVQAALWRDLGQRAGCAERLGCMLFCRNRPHARYRVRPVHLPGEAVRIRIMRGDRVGAVFDLPSGEWLSARKAGDPALMGETLRQFRLASGKERTANPRDGGREVFVIGDLHLGHANIIRFCGRPFAPDGVEEMDEVLIANWNRTVGKGDHVLFLGDLTYNRTGVALRRYTERLNGRITFIRGNHDGGIRHAKERLVMESGGVRLLLLHNPRFAPSDFDGWIIHGHTHNNDLRAHPFIDFRSRRVNVSADVIGFSPLPLSSITALIRAGTRAGRQDAVPLWGMEGLFDRHGTATDNT
jgi:calcineurin-like phosphoesterase family protein